MNTPPTSPPSGDSGEEHPLGRHQSTPTERQARTSPPLFRTKRPIPRPTAQPDDHGPLQEAAGAQPKLHAQQAGQLFRSLQDDQGSERPTTTAFCRRTTTTGTTGASGLPYQTIDTRIFNVRHLPSGPFQLSPGVTLWTITPTARCTASTRCSSNWTAASQYATPANPSGCKADLFPWVGGHGRRGPERRYATAELQRRNHP